MPYSNECEEDHRMHESVLDQIQREAEQELQYAERILSAADDVVAENRECFIRRGCKKMGGMRNMPDQSYNGNYSQQMQPPCPRYAAQDMSPSYYLQESEFTEEYDPSGRPMLPPRPDSPDIFECYDSPEQFTYEVPPPSPNDYLRNDPYCNAYQNERSAQYASGGRSFLSGCSERNPTQGYNGNGMSRMEVCDETNGRNMAQGNRPCRRDTCPVYTCAETDDKSCRQFPVCEKGGKQSKTWPKKPAATQDELHQMIETESKEVDITLNLASLEKKTYKKPCPKQQRAQMSVQHILQSHDTNKYECLKEYGPLSDPDPEDISPELAASMMFAQEQGIKLDDCPQSTIQHLFPDDKKNLNKIPGSTISVLDPKQGKQGDKERLVERSSKVSEVGASDSAYMKTMKKKGDAKGSKKPYEPNTDDDENKKEYVLVPQKPERFNMIQVRGNAPAWFPGYFTGFPESPGIKILDSPSKVLNRAWTLTNPADVPASDITVVE